MLGTVAARQHFPQGLMPLPQPRGPVMGAVFCGFVHSVGVSVAHRLRWEVGPCRVGLHSDSSVCDLTCKHGLSSCSAV